MILLLKGITRDNVILEATDCPNDACEWMDTCPANVFCPHATFFWFNPPIK